MDLEKVAKLSRELIVELGDDPSRDGLLKTPERFAKSLRFLTSGIQENTSEIIHKAMFDESYDNMVVIKKIEFYSLCEHHMLPFFGQCHVGYIPNGKVVGLSKIPRLVNSFARRLQVQERLTDQIATSLLDLLDAKGVGVVMEARHLCMMMRGVEKQNSSTATSSMLGCFRDIATREEFMGHLRMN